MIVFSRLNIYKELFVKIQLGTLFTLISAAIICGGFYYTTELRLESLEAEVSELSDQIKKIRKKNRG